MKNFLKRFIGLSIILSAIVSIVPVASAAGESMEITDVSSGAKTTFTLKLQSSDTLSGVVFVATYVKGTDTLVSVQRYDAIAQRAIEVDTKNGEAVKVMWWNGTSSLTPFTEDGFIPSQSSPLDDVIGEWVQSGTGRQSVNINYQTLQNVSYDF